MPIDVGPHEFLVGKPLFLSPSEDESAEDSAAAERILAEIPPFPGGDPGHFHPDYDTLFALGIDGILERITEYSHREDLASEEEAFYRACGIALQGMQTYAERVAEECERTAGTASPAQAERLRDTTGICRRIAHRPPKTFREAIQLMFLTQICLWFGEDHGLTSPGRIDRTLYRFYRADIQAGSISRHEVFEYLCSLFIHMNNILGPGSAVAVMVGGRDADGRDVTNDLTYLALAARMATALVYPTVAVAWHTDLPEDLMRFIMEMLSTGIGDPALFNDDLIALGLQDHGVTPEDSRNYMNSTCVEIKVVGRSNMWVTQPYFNLAGSLLEAMDTAVDAGIDSYAELEELVRKNIGSKVAAAAARLHAVWRGRERYGGFPLASCLIRDCLDRGMDFDRGGARYNWVENSFVGLANLVDGLNSIRILVFEQSDITLSEFLRILREDFEGHEALRQQIVSSIPHYGNDDDKADNTAVEWAEFLIDETEKHTVGLHRYVPGFFCWIQHEKLGSQTGATPDGRKAGLPLADGAGASQGCETQGPTAAVLSTTKWSHRHVLGGLVHNIKFPRSVLDTPDALDAARRVIETYLSRGGFEIQVNVVGTETLMEAQEHPEQYPDLLVRVAGYSDYFVHLNRKMQDEVIARTNHEF